MSVEHLFDVGYVRGVRRMIDCEKGRRLEVDPAPPTCSRFGQDGPTDSRLWADAVDMGANGRRAVRIGAAQAELHARGHVGGGPIRGAVFDVRGQRAGEIPDWVPLPSPDMALVEMGVHVDEQRQDDAPGHCDFRRFAEVNDARRDDLRDCALVNENVDHRETVTVERPHGPRQRAREHARLLQHIGSGGGEGERRGHRR